MRCELVRGVLDVLRGPDAETSLRIDRRLPDGSSCSGGGVVAVRVSARQLRDY
jgi:hypothetical protein